jgi:hypothetical protein
MLDNAAGFAHALGAAAPDVEDVRRALLVVPAVGATRRDEAMALVEPLRT